MRMGLRRDFLHNLVRASIINDDSAAFYDINYQKEGCSFSYCTEVSV